MGTDDPSDDIEFSELDGGLEEDVFDRDSDLSDYSNGSSSDSENSGEDLEEAEDEAGDVADSEQPEDPPTKKRKAFKSRTGYRVCSFAENVHHKYSNKPPSYC